MSLSVKLRSWGIGVFVLDRVLKWYAQGLPEGMAFSFAPGVEFGHFLNPSLFFFPAWSWIPWLSLAVLIALAILMATHWRNQSLSPSPYPLVPILLGGASNVFDRFAYGGVIDYVNILGIATINLADILILGGLIILIFNTKEHHYGQKR